MTKSQFKKRLKSFSAQWITETDELVVSTLKGREEDFHEYGLTKGYLLAKDVGERIEYYPTQKLIDGPILELQKTTRIF